MQEKEIFQGSLLSFELISSYPHHNGVLWITLVVSKVREFDLKDLANQDLVRDDFKKLSNILASRNEVLDAKAKGSGDDIKIKLFYNTSTDEKIFLDFSSNKGVFLSEDLYELQNLLK